jgi:hypothetical protein
VSIDSHQEQSSKLDRRRSIYDKVEKLAEISEDSDDSSSASVDLDKELSVKGM